MPGNENRKVDAILIPLTYPDGFEDIQRAIEINRRFGPLMGAARISIRNDTENHEQQYLTPYGLDTKDTYLRFPDNHPLKGESRFDWFVARPTADDKFDVMAPVLGLAGDTYQVRFGYLRDEAELTKRKFEARLDPEYERALQEAAASPDTRARMAVAGLLPGQAPADVARASQAAAAAPTKTSKGS